MSKKPPTKEESERMDKLVRIGCCVCRQQHGAYVECEIQHLTSGGRRRGHMFTIPLCAWHHRGVTTNGLTADYMTQIYGPSFAHSRAAFEAAFGYEEALLLQVNDWLGIPRKVEEVPVVMDKPST